MPLCIPANSSEETETPDADRLYPVRPGQAVYRMKSVGNSREKGLEDR
jgi:hypothetical protein